MKTSGLILLAMAATPFCALAADGQVLLNQATVMAAGGFPYVISQTGSYKLSGSLTVPNATTSAINITASNVTLDLNGFGIFGPDVCSGGPPVTLCTNSNLPPNFGVFSTAANVTIINGTISGMGIGIKLDGAIGGVVDRVRLVSNAGVGAFLNLGTLSNSTMLNNGGGGLLGNFVNVIGNVVSGSGVGLSVVGANISGNTVVKNATGMNLGCPSTVVGNTVTQNVTANIVVGDSSCVLANNVQ